MSWTDLAACHPSRRPEGTSPAEWVAMFFPEPGRSARPARAVCEACPVRAECAADAEPEGVWGGMTPRERRLAGRRSGDGYRYSADRRAYAVRLVAEGMTPRDAAARIGAHKRSVLRWINEARGDAA